MTYTVLIPAFNAEKTIARALKSVEKTAPAVILVDDASKDQTVAAARQALPEKLEVITLPENGGVGAARRTALEACKTDYAVWLDADDMFIGDRMAPMLQLLEGGADYVFDQARLFHGETGEYLSHLIPGGELQQVDGHLWQFARNLLPMLGWPAMRVAKAREAGFGFERHAEDYAHLLKALKLGARLGFVPSVGYGQFHYAGSLSRHVGAHRQAVKSILKAVDTDWLRGALAGAALPAYEKGLILLFFLAQRREWECLRQETLTYGSVMAAAPASARADALHFQALATYMLGESGAAFENWCEALALNECAEYYNNIGCLQAVKRVGDGHYFAQASASFKRARALLPGYKDAADNLAAVSESEESGKILTDKKMNLTLLPMRRQAYRDIYS